MMRGTKLSPVQITPISMHLRTVKRHRCAGLKIAPFFKYLVSKVVFLEQSEIL